MPLPFAVVLPITPVPTRVTVTVALASDVPFKKSVWSVVIWSVLEEPVSVVMPVNTGAAAEVSMVTTKFAEVALTLPATSVCVAVKV